MPEEEPTGTGTPEKASKGADEKTTMTATLKGHPDALKKQLGIQPEGTAAPKTPPSNEATLEEALKNPKNMVVVKRIAPRKLEGQSINVEVYRQECPLTIADVTEEVFGEHGGKKFRIAVIDPENGKVLAATVRTNDADPIIPKTEEMDPKFFEDVPQEEPDSAQLTEDALRRRQKMYIAQAEVEQARQQLEALKTQTSGNRLPKGDDDPRVKALEKKLEDMAEESKLARLEERHRQEIAALREELRSTQAPKGDDNVRELIKQMNEDRKAADARMDKILNQMRESKLEAIERQLSELKNKPAVEGNGMKESIELFASVAKILGVDLPGKDGGGGDDDRPWYQKLAEDHLPNIIDKLMEEKGEGGVVSKEELAARISAEADKVMAEEKARIAQRQQQQRVAQQSPAPQAQPAAQPAPAPQAAPKPAPAPAPAPSAYGTPPPAPAPAAETPAPAAAPAPQAASPPADGAPPPAVPSVDDEKRQRCGQVLIVMCREMEIRPRDFKWSFIAWDNLPEDVREKLAKTADATTLTDAFDGFVNPKGLEELKAKIASDPKLARWFNKGLKELGEWQVKLDADPNFDPSSDDDEDGDDGDEKGEGE